MKNNYQRILLCNLAVLGLSSTVIAQQHAETSIYFSDSTLKKADTYFKSSASAHALTEQKSKEVSKEVPFPKNGEIYILNNYLSFQVKTWDQPKVKLTSTVFYNDYEEKTNPSTDEELLNKANISLKVVGSSVKIKTGTPNHAYSTFTFTPSDKAMLATTRVNTIRLTPDPNKKINPKTDLIIYVPAGVKIDIEHKYGYVRLASGITEANIDISNGNLETEDMNKLVLRSKYASASLGNIKNAEVELVNGRLTAKDINDLNIDSKNSSVELATVKTLSLKSTSDEYEMEEVGELRGRKNYGNLRITHLKGLLELEGQNADLKIKNVSTDVSHIKIDDKYADIRIPLRNIKTYSINFAGAFSTVYGDFEKKPVEEKTTVVTSDNKTGANDLKEKVVSGYPKAASGAYATGDAKNQPTTIRLTQLTATWERSDTPSKFTAAAGDGKGIKIDMKCQNCTVDFK